jgi:hypothetical protein
MSHVPEPAADDAPIPVLPAGAAGILPTIWATFVLTVVLGLVFSFGNVWHLARDIGVQGFVSPLIGPVVDFTALGLLVVVPWLLLAGVPAQRMKPANRLMALAGLLTLVLNSAPSAIKGWAHHDPNGWVRAGVEAIVPSLLIAWSHVGPTLIALFTEVQTRHRETVAEAARRTEQDGLRAAEERAAAIAVAVAEAVDQTRREVQAAADREADAVRAELAEAAAHRTELESSLQAAQDALARRTDEVERIRNRTRSTSRTGAKRSAGRAPRKSLDEWVALAKTALPEWQLETPTGSVIGSALDLQSDGTISNIRKRLAADRAALTPDTDAS